MVQTFGGSTFEAKKDFSRLQAQLESVRDLMLDGQWRTLAEIEIEIGHPQPSISARLRDLRKVQFGSFIVERRRVENGNGLHQYRVIRHEHAEASL